MKALTGSFLRGAWISKQPGSSIDAEVPLRSELFSLSQLTRHARQVAAGHAAHLDVKPRWSSSPLLARLDDNEDVLRIFTRTSLSQEESGALTPAARWLLDNFYLLEEQIHLARRHLPHGYNRELPCLTQGPSAGLPRVYDIILELISHLDGQIDAESLNAFVAAYETVSPLKLGELWAIPIMLRLGMIENLRRITTRLARGRYDRTLAVSWIDKLQEMTEHTPSRLVIVVAEMAKADLPLSSSFVSEFSQRLSRKNPVLHLARTWMEQRLTEHGLSIEQMVHQESQHQAADQVSISHGITSLRFLGAMDWKDFVEGLSQVDRILREDPTGVYGRMDFATRDRYRHAVEAFARHGSDSEMEVAKKAVEMAKEAAQKNEAGAPRSDRTAHVGYYLIDKGRPDLERAVRARWPWKTNIGKIMRRHPLRFYVGSMTVLTALATTGFAWKLGSYGIHGAPLWLFAAAFALGSSQAALGLTNLLSMILATPRLLPRLDYSEGIPPDSRTLVAIPTMLTHERGIETLLERLEIHYLGNRDENVHFALLTDFRDAPDPTLPEDEALLHQARAGIELLNLKYPMRAPSPGGSRFFLFHRPRLWNPGEGVWMGYERKRGKLMEFNALLRGKGLERFSEIVGDTSVLAQVRYVITLDTDTQLPRDAARQLAGTLAHPLNRPEFDAKRGIVREGYGILQPRLGVSLPSAGRSWFVRLFAGDAGIDPYTRAVSDIYQDVFGEGSFIGKGIYDVDAFEKALAGRFPENTVLSHDLLESGHVRSALVSDIEFYEDHPSRYNVDADRRHRWVRGDWQILRWLLPRVIGADRNKNPNPLSSLSRWKIFDNLRRSLIAPALIFLLLGSWFLPIPAGVGAAFVLLILALPDVLGILLDLVRKPRDLPLIMHLRKVANSAGRRIGQIFLGFVFLPYETFVHLDAIFRTLWRQMFSRRRLLQWQSSSEVEAGKQPGLAGFFARMWAAPFVAAACAVALAWSRSPLELWPQAAAILAVWLTAPSIAWKISQPLPSPDSDLSESQSAFLRRIARKTWHFFETFVTETDNWLPPDNFQENLTAPVASRTSPTNIGLALLSSLAARDFGYISPGFLLRRTRDTLGTLHRLERYHGHFYNWYDTRTLTPLLPRYVSSVDSGNLAGHLLVLGSGLRELFGEKIFDLRALAGLRDTLDALEAAGDEPEADRKREREAVRAELGKEPATWHEVHEILETLAHRAESWVKNGVTLPALEGSEEPKRWEHALAKTCRDHLEELLFFAPWLSLPAKDVEACVAALRTVYEDTEKTSAAFADSALPVLDGFLNLAQAPTLEELSRLDEVACLRLERELEKNAPSDPKGTAARVPEFLAALREAGSRARQRLLDAETLAAESDKFADMDFTFLFDPVRNLFSVGFNVLEHRLDASFYDILASEARISSYVAIAQGQVPQDHWFSLGRLLVSLGNEPILASWSGSMFEYLMPMLVMPSYENTLLDHTCRAAVRRQIEYGDSLDVPWGISESGYNRTDVHLNFQYRAFGVPGLGLKRGLAEDLVVAPYASMMALMVAPREACDNLRRLAVEGREGPYGFYEAIDYTASRMPPDQSSVTVCSFMAHHQGMSLLSLLFVLKDRPMQRRFLGCPLLKATELLLQERVPRAAANVIPDEFEWESIRANSADKEGIMRVITHPSGSAPEAHLLSNSRYHLVISSAGGGYSRWRDLALTRWREDSTRDNWGSFLYLRDEATGDFWSAALQPTLRTTKHYEAIFTQGRAEFRHRHAGLEVHTEICVSPEDDVELRRITLTNRVYATRSLEITSYAEVVLASAGSDLAHPAFSNLFVQTEFDPRSNSILATRRPRSEDEDPPWLLHAVAGQGGDQGEASCETDRMRFIGRGGSLAKPAALQSAGPLSNTAGSVLDPVVALRRTVKLGPNETAVLVFITGAADNRSDARGLVNKYQNTRMIDRAFDLTWTHSQVTLRHLDASESEAQLFGRLAGALVYADPARRANASILLNNRRGQSSLWAYGISGDSPIVLLRVSEMEKIELVRQLVRAHAYWRLKGLTVELVILIEDVSVYRQSLHEQITAVVTTGIEMHMLDKAGGIFIRRLEQIPPEDLSLLMSTARVVLNDGNGTLAEQLESTGTRENPVPMLSILHARAEDSPPTLPSRELLFGNGLGGFTPDGSEYVITLQPGRNTPAPWVNVLANPRFGAVVSESGGGYTWAENSHEFRLTPWNNDPVQDTSGEAFYLRDEHTGLVWSPTPAPARGQTPYVIRHGFGYTVFEHVENGIASELCVYVSMDAPVKFMSLKMRNLSGHQRRISATGYFEWVLGDLRTKSLLHVQTEVDLRTGALMAQNPYNTEFPEHVAFLDVSDPTRTVTGSRREFIGRNGTLAQPAALKRVRLSGKVGAGLDPCGAMQVTLDLSGGQERETVFRLGMGKNMAEARDLIQRFRRSEAPRAVLEDVRGYWSHVLGAVNVDTPDASVNVLANGWLVYQTLACRLLGRTGFYQSGGAYGFRDQLQDVMALVHAEPALARAHLLRAAARQFREGDVQHWWHPPVGRGVRTHFSDDYLWLPYAVCRYVGCLADTGVLDEKIAFLDGRPVKPEEESYYDLPNRSEEAATLYQHCVRAIENGLKFGKHGLPLMGCGDWNDGMNLVGKDGRGESVWLAFFLHDVLAQFGELAAARGDEAFAARCRAQALQLQENVERNGWDGDWYLRAFFDDGTPLGSHVNEECRLDSLPQSWAVISGAGDPERARKGMQAVENQLVRRDDKLILLFDPPFDKAHVNPGYIKGYIPGVRENGGQYTHAAVWAAMATALAGHTDRAWELFALINPVLHGSTPEQIATYKVEPYVVAADVYGRPPHTGRGGWTWYTGSAGWMYRLLVETLLGLDLRGDRLRLLPHIPKAWDQYKIHYRYRTTTYHITISRMGAGESAPTRLILDGRTLTEDSIPLVDDHQEHFVELQVENKKPGDLESEEAPAKPDGNLGQG